MIYIHVSRERCKLKISVIGGIMILIRKMNKDLKKKQPFSFQFFNGGLISFWGPYFKAVHAESRGV